jgi:hypothetical protein
MANSSTPDSPLDLVSRQGQEDFSEKESFFDKVGKLVCEEQPCICEMQAVTERLIAMMLFHHSEVLASDEGDLTPWARATWKKDKKRLKKALALVRDVH